MAVIAMVVMLVPAFRIVMMRTPGGFVHQLAIEIRGGKRLRRRVRFTRPDLDAFLGEDGDRMLANAAHDDDARALLPQPAREQPRRAAAGVTVRVLRIFRCPGSACTSVNSRQPPKCP